MDASNIGPKAKCFGSLWRRCQTDVSGMTSRALQPSPLLRARAQSPAACRSVQAPLQACLRCGSCAIIPYHLNGSITAVATAVAEAKRSVAAVQAAAGGEG
jgi:hypothetical protein